MAEYLYLPIYLYTYRPYNLHKLRRTDFFSILQRSIGWFTRLEGAKSVIYFGFLRRTSSQPPAAVCCTNKQLPTSKIA